MLGISLSFLHRYQLLLNVETAFQSVTLKWISDQRFDFILYKMKVRFHRHFYSVKLNLITMSESSCCFNGTLSLYVLIETTFQLGKVNWSTQHERNFLIFDLPCFKEFPIKIYRAKSHSGATLRYPKENHIFLADEFASLLGGSEVDHF